MARFLSGRMSGVLLLAAVFAFAKSGPIFSIPNNPTVYALQRDTAGNVYLAGDLRTGRNDFQAFVAKIGNDGRVVYFTTFGGTSTDTATALAIAADGSIVAVGGTISYDFPVTVDASQKQ